MVTVPRGCVWAVWGCVWCVWAVCVCVWAVCVCVWAVCVDGALPRGGRDVVCKMYQYLSKLSGVMSADECEKIIA